MPSLLSITSACTRSGPRSVSTGNPKTPRAVRGNLTRTRRPPSSGVHPSSSATGKNSVAISCWTGLRWDRRFACLLFLISITGADACATISAFGGGGGGATTCGSGSLNNRIAAAIDPAAAIASQPRPCRTGVGCRLKAARSFSSTLSGACSSIDAAAQASKPSVSRVSSASRALRTGTLSHEPVRDPGLPPRSRCFAPDR